MWMSGSMKRIGSAVELQNRRWGQLWSWFDTCLPSWLLTWFFSFLLSGLRRWQFSSPLELALALVLERKGSAPSFAAKHSVSHSGKVVGKDSQDVEVFDEGIWQVFEAGDLTNVEE